MAAGLRLKQYSLSYTEQREQLHLLNIKQFTMASAMFENTRSSTLNCCLFEY